MCREPRMVRVRSGFDIAFGPRDRPLWESLMQAARRSKIDSVVVWQIAH
jgi:hypothetical protein